MSTRAERLYSRLPVRAQHVAISAYGYGWRHRRQGGRFWEFRRGFREREALSEKAWADWQDGRLRQILRIAARAPHYHDQWRGLSIEEGDLESFRTNDLKGLPLLSKDQVRRAPQALCPGGKPGRGTSAWYTSGSTGTPLTTYHNVEDFRRALAIRDARYEASVGVTYRMPRATIRSRIVVPDPASDGPFHRFNLAERQTYLSAYHLGPKTIQTYLDALWRHRPVWLDGHASSIHEIARLALEHGISCPPVSAVVASSEPTTDRMRADVGRAFGCGTTEEYGLVEECCFALECDQGSLHISPDAGFVEILDEQGDPVRPGEAGEIVATGFLREAQPFVRYRTGDLGSWSTSGCRCGLNMPVLQAIEGRLDDVLVGADGRRLRRLSTVPRNLPGVVLTQFVQDRPGAVVVRVVCEGQLTDAARSELADRLRARLGTDTDVQVRQVPALERTARGKIRNVVSRIRSG